MADAWVLQKTERKAGGVALHITSSLHHGLCLCADEPESALDLQLVAHRDAACAMQSTVHRASSHGEPDLQDPPPILACTQHYLQTPNIALGTIRYKDIRGLEIQSIVQLVADSFPEDAFALLGPISATHNSFSAIIQITMC